MKRASIWIADEPRQEKESEKPIQKNADMLNFLPHLFSHCKNNMEIEQKFGGIGGRHEFTALPDRPCKLTKKEGGKTKSAEPTQRGRLRRKESDHAAFRSQSSTTASSSTSSHPVIIALVWAKMVWPVPPKITRQEPSGADGPILSSPDRQEKERLIQALRQTGGNQSEAARRLNVSRVTVWKQIKKHGIDLDTLLSE